MTSSTATGMAQTVLGLVEPRQIGFTLPREHILFDLPAVENPTQMLTHSTTTVDKPWNGTALKQSMSPKVRLITAITPVG